MKDHIKRLPVVDWGQHVGKLSASADIAISIPLFSSNFQFIRGGNSREHFQDIHVKGAIWTAIAFANNTDLLAKGVQLYFHIEKKCVALAKPIFKQFNVPSDTLRAVDFNKQLGVSPQKARAAIRNIKNVCYGKKFMCLLDPLEDIHNWVIADSDCLPCTSDGRMEMFDVLRSKPVRQNPASIDYQFVHFDKQHWINRIADAAGIVFDDKLKEKQVFKKLGLEPPEDTMLPKIYRPITKTTLLSIPTQHEIVAYIKRNILSCCEDEFLLAAYSLTSPFVNMGTMLNIRVPLSPQEYGQTFGQYFHHLIFASEDSRPYFTRFVRDLTRNLILDSYHIESFEQIFGSIR